MSTFPGSVEEIPGISIDQFEGENSESSAFFLSHCHSDHMAGLNNSFFSKLRQNNRNMYCSHISRACLISMHPHSSRDILDHLIELTMDEPHIIDYVHENEKLSVTVTCIPAGHCPGSVMFLFRYKHKQILYTGDFRINKQDFPKLRSLHLNNKTQCIPIHIDKIYLDTTFLNPKFQEFPSRVESSKALCKAVKNWLEVDPSNIVSLELSANYGSEFLFMDLARNLDMKIHVKNKVYDVYSKMEYIAGIVTNIAQETRIHACMNKIQSMQESSELNCRPEVKRSQILTIVPSVQRWSGKDTSAVIEHDKKKPRIYVCYSTHASLNELEAFIEYFKPISIYPCVCNGENEKERINDLLSEIDRKYRQPDDSPPPKKSKITFSNHKTFVKKSNFKSQVLSDDDSDAN